MPNDYLVAQLKAFRSGDRGNDSKAQMRSAARPMTDQEWTKRPRSTRAGPAPEVSKEQHLVLLCSGEGQEPRMPTLRRNIDLSLGRMLADS
jgi:hypothetical protein